MLIAKGQEEDYREYKEGNSDPYGEAVVTYSERWADLMEQHLAAGETFKQFAKSTSHEADVEGITGFMYACAVSGLSKFWVYGEELRRWHNLDTQLGKEGEAANESGGVLNPALLTIQSPKTN